MNVQWTATAIRHLYALHTYIQERNGSAADGVVNKVTDAVDWLGSNAKAGRPGRVAGTREWVVQKTPYVVAYEVSGSSLRVLAVMHGAQRWPVAFDNDATPTIH